MKKTLNIIPKKLLAKDYTTQVSCLLQIKKVVEQAARPTPHQTMVWPALLAIDPRGQSSEADRQNKTFTGHNSLRKSDLHIFGDTIEKIVSQKDLII